MGQYRRVFLSILIVVIILLLALLVFYLLMMMASSHNIPASTYNWIYLDMGVLSGLLVLVIYFKRRTN